MKPFCALQVPAILLALCALVSAHADDGFSGQWTRPAPDTSRDSDSLLRSLNTDASAFIRLRYLLPEKFRIAQAAPFQRVIDDTVLKMSRSDAGKKAICSFAAESAKDVQTFFQVSEPAAAAIRQSCRGFPIPESVKRALSGMRSTAFGSTPAKKFIFIASESGAPSIEGYTSRNNTSYILLTKENMRPELIQKIVAHEIAISYDQLSRLGYMQNPATIEDMGVHLAFGLRLGEEAFVRLPNLKEVKCAFRDPALRYAASAQRAFEFEDLVGIGKSSATTGSCAQILAKNAMRLNGMSRIVSWDTNWYEAGCGIAKDPRRRLEQVVAHIKTIERTQLTCLNKQVCGGKATMSLCDLLLHPRVGPNSRDLTGEGPRPRMGSGWGEATDSSLQRATEGAPLTPAEQKKAGEELGFPNSDELFYEERAGTLGRGGE